MFHDSSQQQGSMVEMSNVSIKRVKSELMKVSESQYECDYLVTSFPFHHIKLVTDLLALLAYDQVPGTGHCNNNTSQLSI